MAPPTAPEGKQSGWLGGERLAQLGPLIALLLVCAFFTTQSDRFLSGANFSLIFQQVMVLGVLAIGQTIVILTAGIDLSCGTVMAFGSIVMTKLAVDSGVPPVLAILLGLLACAAFGAVNGGLVTRLGLPPFIVTLGTFYIAFALTHIYSNEETISNLPGVMTALYCDVSDVWQMSSKWQRLAVSAAGMLVEVVVAALAFIVWWHTEPGLLNTWLLGLAIICSVNTVVVNANPLLRYDGHYLLADWLEIPNLGSRGQGLLGQKLRRLVAR